jgi:hypothetical protein
MNVRYSSPVLTIAHFHRFQAQLVAGVAISGAKKANTKRLLRNTLFWKQTKLPFPFH